LFGTAGALLLAATLPSAAPAHTTAAAQRLQIWFIRRAESEIDAPHARRTIPHDGVSRPLTLEGMQQAKALAASLETAPLLAIYSSPRLPAIQTADAIAFQRGMTVALAPEAVEIDLGLREGEDVQTVYGALTHQWTVERNIDARHADGESFADAQRRFLPFVRELMNRHALDSGVIAIVAHGATLELLVPVLTTNVPADFALRRPLPHGGIIKTELRDSKLYCTEWAGLASREFERGK
jgi:probable phosphoglycerate mutase